jgi:molybdenum-dependent DNA-binding transcriptional regulator ModE
MRIAQDGYRRGFQRPAVNLARLDLVSMQLLLHCAASGSISAASEHSHLSIMGASARLRRLEETLGKPLFHRHRHGLELTEAGAAAVAAARTMMLAVDSLLDEVRSAVVSPAMRRDNPGRRGRRQAPHGQETGSGEPGSGLPHGGHPA